MMHLQSHTERRFAVSFCRQRGPVTEQVELADCVVCLREAILQAEEAHPFFGFQRRGPQFPIVDILEHLGAFLKGVAPPPSVPLWWCRACDTSVSSQKAVSQPRLFCPQCGKPMERRRGKADTKTGAITVDFEPAREIDGGQKLALPPGEPPKK